MSASLPVEVVGLEGLAEIVPGDDLASILAPTLTAAGIRDGDVVVVTSKIVSKAEGRLMRTDDRSSAIEGETVRVVARRGPAVIAETRHGFVCANAGVDASNVETGTVALLPLDPDGSAERLRAALDETPGIGVAVIITDTFGRPWRTGVVNVAIGCAGLPAVVDLRGRLDHRGRELDATVVALADEVAAASGLVMAKDARVPVAIVRGVNHLATSPGVAADLIRPGAEDLFRASTLETIRSLGRSPGNEGAHPQSDALDTFARQGLVEAIAACEEGSPSGPARRFVVIDEGSTVHAILASTNDEPTRADDAGLLVALFLDGPQHDAGDDPAEWWIAAGRSIETFAIAVASLGLATHWIERSSFEPAVLGRLAPAQGLVPLGIMAVQPMGPRTASRWVP